MHSSRIGQIRKLYVHTIDVGHNDIIKGMCRSFSRVENSEESHKESDLNEIRLDLQVRLNLLCLYTRYIE